MKVQQKIVSTSWECSTDWSILITFCGNFWLLSVELVSVHICMFSTDPASVHICMFSVDPVSVHNCRFSVNPVSAQICT